MKKIHKPSVSIICITYNQENYIASAIESFLMQEQSTYNLEIIIADDASTDRTSEIIKKYYKKHPNLINAILRNENIGIQDNLVSALNIAKGDYIALCEGDDYWTDYKKLEMQVSFLEKNNDYALCFHQTLVQYENNEEKPYLHPQKGEKFDLNHLITENYIPTNSVMYRAKSYHALNNKIMPFDWYLHLLHARTGKIKYIDRPMSVYRKHAGGIFWDSYMQMDKIWTNNYEGYCELDMEIINTFDGDKRYQQSINDKIFHDITSIFNADERLDAGVVPKILCAYPELMRKYFYLINKKYQKSEEMLRALINENESTKYAEEKLKEAIEATVSENVNLRNRLSLIEKSKIWRLRMRLAKLARRS